MWRSSRTELSVFVALLGAATMGCRQDMHDQHKVEPLERSPVFVDGRSARHPIEGTVARGELRVDRHLYEGKRRLTEAGAGGAPSEASSIGRGEDDAADSPPSTEADHDPQPEPAKVESDAETPDDLEEDAAMAPDPVDEADTSDIVDTFPYPITVDDLKRGRERYDIFCSPCHSRTGGRRPCTSTACERPSPAISST